MENNEIIRRMKQLDPTSDEYASLALLFFRQNERFFYYKMNQLKIRTHQREDVMSEMKYAVLQSLKTFDCDHGVDFLTYAGNNIDFKVKTYFRNNTVNGYNSAMETVDKAMDLLEARGIFDPTIQQLSQVSNISENVLVGILQAYRPISIEELMTDDDNRAGYRNERVLRDDSVDIIDEINNEEKISNLRKAISFLPENQKFVIEEIFFNGKTYFETGLKMNCTRQNVELVKQNAISNLKDLMNRTSIAAINKLEELRTCYANLVDLYGQCSLDKLLTCLDMTGTDFSRVVNITIYKYKKRLELLGTENISKIITKFNPIAKELILEVCILGKPVEDFGRKYNLTKNQVLKIIVNPKNKKLQQEIDIENER